MPNPIYLPPPRDPFESILPFAMKLYEMKQRKDIAEQELSGREEAGKSELVRSGFEPIPNEELDQTGPQGSKLYNQYWRKSPATQAQGSYSIGDIDGQKVVFTKDAKGNIQVHPLQRPPVEKPTSQANWIDAFGIEKEGDAYNTKEGQSKVMNYIRTHPDEAREFQRQFTLRNTPAAISFLQTDQGFVPAVTKGQGAGTLGQPTGVGKPTPSGAAEKIGALDAISNDIEQTKILYGYGTDKEKTEWVGPVYGRVGAFKEKYTGGATPEQVKFYAYVRNMKDDLLRAKSGAQINEQEYQRLVSFLPDENTPDKTFKARLERFEWEVKNIKATKLKALQEGGYGSQKAKKVNNDPLGIR